VIRCGEGHVRLAEDHRSSGSQSDDRVGVAVRHMFCQVRKAARRRHTRHFERILDGDR
jgi:hypothetical protein